MNYLGEQNVAKSLYYAKVKCWLSVKFLGKYSKINPKGYKCDQEKCTYCSGRPRKSSEFSPYADFFLPKLEDIIKSPPDNLLKLEKTYKKEWFIKGLGDEEIFNDVCSILFKIRGYKGWFTENSVNYELAEWLDRHTCTYCNRQYIFVARKINGDKGMICQFDHWFDKGKHPLLALSFYNLIPSCSVCNSAALKGSNSFTTKQHLHPYIDKDVLDKYLFSYRKKSLSENEITVKSLEPKDLRVERTINDLNLNLIYRNHSSKELEDLIDLRKKYSKNYLKILLEKTFDKELSITEEEKYRLIFGIEINDDKRHQRIFSKFKFDIISELLRHK